MTRTEVRTGAVEGEIMHVSQDKKRKSGWLQFQEISGVLHTARNCRKPGVGIHEVLIDEQIKEPHLFFMEVNLRSVLPNRQGRLHPERAVERAARC